MTQTSRGMIVIISSPSGGGKTSICRKILTRERRNNGWVFSVSYTTRQKRRGERNGREYFFVSDAEFTDMVKQDQFAEHFQVHLYKYGTPRRPLEQVRKRGGVMLLDVDIQGAFKLKAEYPDAVTIFILPPSQSALKHRLTQRGTETREQLRIRFERARQEMRAFDKFNYVVINHELDKAVRQVLSIIEAHPCRIDQVDSEQIRRTIG